MRADVIISESDDLIVVVRNELRGVEVLKSAVQSTFTKYMSYFTVHQQPSTAR